MTTTWQTLEDQRLLSGAQVYRVSWRCEHSRTAGTYFGQHQPAVYVRQPNRCADCRTEINPDSMRCQPCANQARRGEGYRGAYSGGRIS